MKLLKLVLISQISFGLMANEVPLPTQADIDNGNLTDQDKIIMENYEHAGFLQRDYEDQLKQECATKGKDEADCANIARGGDATTGEKFMGMSPAMMKTLSQSYTMIIGMTDIGAKMPANPDKEWTVKEPKKAFGMDEKKAETTDAKDATKTDDAAKEDEEVDDYCRFVAMGTETISMFQNKTDQEFIMETPSRTETAQVTALEKQSRSHASREKSVNTQIVGWGATTACYTAMMMGPASPTAWQNYLKLGASALMWRYYDWEKSEHKKAKDILNSVAKKLKGSGDCNPISDRDCYCSQPETMNDVKYCMPQIRQRTGNSNEYQLTCVNEQLKQDPMCNCVANDTCLDKTIRNNLESMHIPQTAANKLNPFFKMTKGTIKPGSDQFAIDSASNKMFATATNLLRENADKVNLPLNSLTKEQKAMAKSFEELGLPKKAAIGLAGMKISPKAEKNASKFKSAKGRSLRLYSGKRYKPRKKSNALYFSGGKGMNKSKVKKKDNSFANMMNKFKKKGRKNSKSNSDVLKFAERASRKAQISTDKSEDIFKIISRRYQVTARKRLEVE